MFEIKEWISTVLIAAFIINIIELLLPSGNLKPYCKLALSFILLFIMVSPILNFINKDTSIENIMLKRYNQFEMQYNEKLQGSKVVNQENICQNYSNYLKESMNLKLRQYGYEVDEIEIEDNEIKNLKVKKTDKNSNNKDVGEIELNGNENVKTAFNNSTKVEQEIKNDMKKIYNVSVEKIQIN